jgi:hypothetical protein
MTNTPGNRKKGKPACGTIHPRARSFLSSPLATVRVTIPTGEDQSFSKGIFHNLGAHSSGRLRVRSKRTPTPPN